MLILRPRDPDARDPIRATQIYLLKSSYVGKLEPARILFWPPGRRDVAAREIAAPFEWNEDPYGDRNWCGQVHMWRMLDDHLIAYAKTGDAKWLEVPVALMLDWYDYHLVRANKSAYAWKDMMVGLRAMKLAYVASAWQTGLVDLPEHTVTVLDRLAQRHLDFLLDKRLVAYSNHTFFDLHGAAALASIAVPAVQARVAAHVKEVLPRLVSSQFNEHGVHLENSPEYHTFGIRCLRRLQEAGWFDDYHLDDVIAKATATLHWFKLPDGRTVPVGDSGGGFPKPERVVPQGADGVFNESGYVVIRQSRENRSDRSSYLFFMGAHNSRFHKQLDDLSLVWFEGEDILCDAGKYAYKSDDSRGYAISTRAHNTIEIDGQNTRPAMLSPHPELVYGSAVRSVEQCEWGYLICSRLAFEHLGAVHSRYVLYRPGDWLLVVDRLVATKPRRWTQWFHFAPELTLTPEGPNQLGARLVRGSSLTMRFGASAPATLETFRGAEQPRKQGWISRAYRQMEANDAVGISCTADSALMATLFVVGGRRVALAVQNSQLTMTAATPNVNDRLSVAIGDGSCRVRRRIKA